MWLIGCSPRAYIGDKISQALTSPGGGSAFASDNDPVLVADALPFAMKAYESLLVSRPNDRALLAATARMFTLYAVAFVQMPADMLSDRVVQKKEYDRAKRLLRRAREYSLRSLAVQHPGIDTLILSGNTDSAAARIDLSDTTALYLTAAAWAAELTTGKPGLKSLFAFPRVSALMNRLLDLDPSFGSGAVHDFFIAFHATAPRSLGGDPAKARKHYDASLALSQGQRAAPYIIWAAKVCVKQKNREEFVSALNTALAIPVDKPTPNRLSNVVYQDYARWLLSQTDQLF